jgi:hypothetical protein
VGDGIVRAVGLLSVKAGEMVKFPRNNVSGMAF